MIITYKTPTLSREMKDTLTTYLQATFPGCKVVLEEAEETLKIDDVDDLRYLKRAVPVVASLINLSKYVSEAYK